MSPGRRSLASTAVLICLVLVLAACSSSSSSGPAAVKRLPEVTLQSLGGGEPVDLRSLRGPLVVNLWASWCVPCRTELPLYAAFAKKYAGRVDVLGIDFQETRVEAALQLARKSGVRYPLLADPDGAVR
ncbi:MAG: TlpA disulfide reductase family protein, partial [Marmoricola sp.]